MDRIGDVCSSCPAESICPDSEKWAKRSREQAEKQRNTGRPGDGATRADDFDPTAATRKLLDGFLKSVAEAAVNAGLTECNCGDPNCEVTRVIKAELARRRAACPGDDIDSTEPRDRTDDSRGTREARFRGYNPPPDVSEPELAVFVNKIVDTGGTSCPECDDPSCPFDKAIRAEVARREKGQQQSGGQKQSAQPDRALTAQAVENAVYNGMHRAMIQDRQEQHERALITKVRKLLELAVMLFGLVVLSVVAFLQSFLRPKLFEEYLDKKTLNVVRKHRNQIERSKAQEIALNSLLWPEKAGWQLNRAISRAWARRPHPIAASKNKLKELYARLLLATARIPNPHAIVSAAIARLRLIRPTQGK